jgi:hypothetical protein
MSYSDFNNAYQNINHKLVETFDGITTEDLNENNTQFDYSKVPINYIKSEEELNGTTLLNLNNNKLTHRICIQLYKDPTNLNNPNMPIVLKHISNCSLCQNEIKKKSETYENLESTEQKKNNYTNINNSNIQDYNQISQVSTLNQSNNIEKFENVSRINLTINELETLLKNVINTDKKNVVSSEKNDEYDNINKILKTLENKKKPLSIEVNFLNIMICLLIILLIIDIILRIKS